MDDRFKCQISSLVKYRQNPNSVQSNEGNVSCSRNNRSLL